MAINGKGRPTKEQKKERDLYQELMGLVTAYDRDFEKWTKRTEEIIKKYRDEQRKIGDTQSKFNILWSNVQTLVPATYARLPQPDVSRRFKDQDPVGRVGALIIERDLDYDINHYSDFRSTMKSCVLDRFLGGRGTAWARYEPHIEAKVQNTPTDGVNVTEDIDEPEEELDYECAPIDYVHWRDFGHNVARTWEEVHTVWRKVYMGRQACIDRFGEELGSQIPLDSRPEGQNKEKEDQSDTRALVYEFWVKTSKKALWVSKSLGKVLDKRDDPLELEQFFPCPKPLYATLSNESLVPVPDFALYQDQARSLDTLCDRIDGLIQALQVKGVYNSEFPEIGRLFTEATNTNLIPVKAFNAFAEKQGLKGALDMVDLTPIFNALTSAYEAFQQVLKQIYDITGLADIIRGQSEASETATAQQIKGQYASLRLNSMKHDVALFATEILQLKAQVMLGKFEQSTLLKMAAVDQLSQQDQQMIPQAMELLKNEPMQGFRIDIAADSLVQIDEQEEKQARTEFIKVIGTYLKDAQPVVQGAPMLAPLVLELLKFGATAFKVGKTVEGLIDETAEKLKAAAEQAMSQPKPDPEMEKVKGQQMAEQAKLQADQQAKSAEFQQEQMRMQMESQFEQQRQQMEEAARVRELQMEASIEQARNQMEAQRAAMQAQLDAALKRFEIQANNEAKIEVAEISANATLQAAQTTAAESATGAE
jgi:hypothetical protein